MKSHGKNSLHLRKDYWKQAGFEASEKAKVTETVMWNIQDEVDQNSYYSKQTKKILFTSSRKQNKYKIIKLEVLLGAYQSLQAINARHLWQAHE